MAKMMPELKSSPVITRCKNGEPVLSKKDIPYEAECIFNAGVAKFKEQYVMIFRNDYQYNGAGAFKRCCLGIAFSQDGVDWKVQRPGLMSCLHCVCRNPLSSNQMKLPPRGGCRLWGKRLNE
ncbi:MAG TPA: hypothetical protein DC053_08015 [Lachnoclostridium sp.]|nr:hypothetical protein [Lachnoclostridium sp.]